MSFVFLVARPRREGCSAFEAFREKSRPVIDAFDGSLEDSQSEARGNGAGSKEGMVVRFDTIAQARDFYESEDYAKLRGTPTQ